MPWEGFVIKCYSKTRGVRQFYRKSLYFFCPVSCGICIYIEHSCDFKGLKQTPTKILNIISNVISFNKNIMKYYSCSG